MKLTYDTFKKGMDILSFSYLDWKFDKEDEKMLATWYSRLVNMISEQDFLSAVNYYTQIMDKGPNSPLALKTTYAEKCFNAPSPTLVAHALIEAPRRMLLSDFMYENPSVERQKEYLLSDLVMHYPAFRNNCTYAVVVTLTNDYFEVIVDTVSRNDTTEVSILTSELKASYRKELQKSVSHAVISDGLLEANNPLLLN